MDYFVHADHAPRWGYAEILKHRERELIQIRTEGYRDTEPLPVQNSTVLPEIRTSAFGTSLDPPLHNHAVLQTGRLDRQTVVLERAIWESCPDSIRSHVVFGTRTRVEYSKHVR